MLVRACLRSGLCCRKAPCGFGEVTSPSDPQCKFLLIHDNDTTSCGRYNEIIKDPSSKFSPAFGAGCCMPIGNTYREKILKEIHHNEEQFIEIKMV